MQIANADIGLLHPGAMGAEIGRALLTANPDRRVLWAGRNRSAESRQRADAVGLDDVDALDVMVASAGAIVSVCPPGAALDQARAVAETGFDGHYLDANAVSPATARAIAEVFDGRATVIDGGIIGPPPARPGTTRLYLSGTEAESTAEWFAGSDLEVRLVEGGPGAASAVKMCFAGWTKGTSALLFALRSLAEAEGVTDALLGEWETSMPDLIVRSERSAAGVSPKAWRFEGEMHEIADSLSEAGLPDGFHRAAAEIYRRMAGLKGRPPTGEEAATLAEVMAAILETDWAVAVRSAPARHRRRGA